MTLKQFIRIMLRRETEKERIMRKARSAVRSARIQSTENKKIAYTDNPDWPTDG